MMVSQRSLSLGMPGRQDWFGGKNPFHFLRWYWWVWVLRLFCLCCSKKFEFVIKEGERLRLSRSISLSRLCGNNLSEFSPLSAQLRYLNSFIRVFLLSGKEKAPNKVPVPLGPILSSLSDECIAKHESISSRQALTIRLIEEEAAFPLTD